MKAPASRLARIEGIVIGASAGGVEALSVLLPALPASLQPSVFIVQHLRRQQPSLLVQIFAPICALPVREAEDKLFAQPGTIYLAPPDYHLLLDKGPQLALSIDELVHFTRPSIDVLFESAADVYADRLMGIILSGGNQDGAAGLAAVDRCGGVTVVQEPASAQVPLMVLSALEQSLPDYVLTIEGIADLLRALPGRASEPDFGPRT